MKSLLDKGNAVIQARAPWERKQLLYYQMRHDGLRRRSKPFPGAADLHFPLIDMNIRKGKPFWMSQATSSERLASFVALSEQDKDITSGAADFFDFELKQNTNYLPELFRAIDIMCLRGRGVLKVTTDAYNENKIVFKAIDPIKILMPMGADDFDDADHFVHVQHYTVESYKRERRFAQDEDIIRQIRGAREQDTSQNQDQEKQIHEGVNFTNDHNQIIIWEHWVKTMGGHIVHTYSPMKADLVLRQPFLNPYKGLDKKPSVPFFSIKMEVKDEGWYSPRGMGELGAPFETFACKLWNEKTDAMTFANRPVFTTDQATTQNIGNVRWAPGEFIPGNIKSVQVNPPAYSFDQEIAFARSTSEQQNMLPDFGIQQPGQPGQPGSPRTATENNRIATLQSVGTEASGMIFRHDLGRMYRHTWGLFIEFQPAKLLYYAKNELKTLPKQAIHSAYLIMPDGSPDQWNKDQRLQRAYARYAQFKGNPNCSQDVLTRDTMAADDPKFALEAFVPSGVAQGKQAEDEAMEIVIMVDGFPAEVQPSEDHATRIHVLASWLQKQAMQRRPVDPVAKQRILEHMAVHFQILQQTQPQVAKQIQAQIEQMERSSGAGQPAGPGQIAGAPMGATETPPGGPPMG